MSGSDPRLDIGAQAVVANNPLSWLVAINATLSDGVTVVPVDLSLFGTTWTGTLRNGSPDAVPSQAWTIDATGSPRTTSADGHTTSGSATVTSASAAFTSADVGRKIAGTNIPAGTTIASVTNSTTAVMSAQATGTATTTAFTINTLGVILLSLTATQTNAMTGSDNGTAWQFDLKVTDGTTPFTPFKGSLTVWKANTA